MIRIAPLLTAAALAGLALPAAAARLTPEARLARALEGKVAGTPVSCINTYNIRSSEVIDGKAILYRTSSDRFYLNTPPSGASSLDSDDILVSRTPTTQLCNLDIVTLVDRASGFFAGSVGLGEFVPYAPAKPD